MGAAINNYFKSAMPAHDPSPPVFATATLNAHRERNRQILSPTNTLRIKNTPIQNSPPATNDFAWSELGLPRNSLILAQSSRSQAPPSMQDVESSPRLVLHDTTYI
jgi:hypothetical protein